MREKKERKSTATIRKAFKHGESSQKMMSFKVDLENWEAMEGEVNKGRLINNLLREHYSGKGEEVSQRVKAVMTTMEELQARMQLVLELV